MIERLVCDVWNATLPREYDDSTIVNAELGSKPSCRAFRIVGDSLKFLFLKVPRAYPDKELRVALRTIVANGLTTRVSYKQRNDGYLNFAFLGFTESGIKSGHIILLQKPADPTREKVLSVASLLQAFGDLQEVYIKDGPGKYAARLSLAFSATVQSVNPSYEQVVQISDKKARNGVLTTDGCGIIRESYAREIRSRHNLESGTCVFQIRRGGVKGLIVAYPDDKFDSICRRCGDQMPYDHKIAYRPSMLKFDGGPTCIEINGISEPPKQSARLNDFIIIILVSLAAKYGGIGRLFQALKELLKLHLRRIEMIAYDRQEALNYISGELDAEGDAYFQDLYEMLLAGHSMDDAHIRKRIRTCQRLQYSSLKDKLSILVQKSCYVYGVVDELGVLAEDEVFIHIPQREGVVVPRVLVARQPLYRRSDVRVMKAVNKPELDFLTNCIVFPRSGRFSIPGSMSGGDLDGDMYFVCWEPTILPQRTELPRGQSSQAAAPAIDWSRRNLNDALLDLFIKQHHNKVLGMASNEWQSVVEGYAQMAGAKYPRELAGIVEEALDILKSGGSYEALHGRYRDILSDYRHERVDKKRKQKRSRLRILRRMIPSIEEDKDPQYQIDQDLILRDEEPLEWDEFYEQGKALIQRFNKGLEQAMSKDEADKGDEISRHRAEDGRSYADEYYVQFRDKYFPRSNNSILSNRTRQLYIRASAWYHLGYTRDRPAFAWLGARFLNSTKSFKTNGGRPGLSVGSLKRLEDTEEQLEEQYRVFLLYSTPYDATRRPNGLAMSIRRVDLDII